MDKDVTRLAVERALKFATQARENLKRQLFTGPSRVRLTPKEFEHQLASGNSRLLRHAVDLLDDEQLARIIAGASNAKN